MKNEQLTKVTLPKDAWAELDNETQFAILLLGHIFNEIVTLEKLLVATHPHDQQTRIERSGSVSQSTLLQRILVGKLYEAKASLSSKIINRFLKDKCFPHMQEGEGEALLKDFHRSIGACQWLPDARNKHSLHYPTMGVWEPLINGMRVQKEAFKFIMGSRDGDLLYETADNIANMSFFANAGGGDWKSGVDIAFTEIRAISKKLHELITVSIDAFFTAYGSRKLPASKRLKLKQAETFSTPRLLTFKIPYFFDLRGSIDDSE
ncbi:hypothetical protein QYH69_32305 [Paraburkholderia sp. SARCC-3016]|uniref:hypothetical protein n=1 Tax=Paraburkholderia sp. SARCC-3016 TaxID=3058611 RepID=UPI0028074776|nr:hypothetical protein [Paraburkholderia sp. SARCC-3016]MDQ7981907.1 hypothetical protein [Paraburkholderia sp. SARCC-3016]